MIAVIADIERMDEMDLIDISRRMKALSDPNRLTILSMISGSELCACKILEELDITQPTLSHHMKVLSEAGLISVRPDGKWSHYSLNEDAIRSTIEYLQSLEKRRSADILCGEPD